MNANCAVLNVVTITSVSGTHGPNSCFTAVWLFSGYLTPSRMNALIVPGRALGPSAAPRPFFFRFDLVAASTVRTARVSRQMGVEALPSCVIQAFGCLLWRRASWLPNCRVSVAHRRGASRSTGAQGGRGPQPAGSHRGVAQPACIHRRMLQLLQCCGWPSPVRFQILPFPPPAHGPTLSGPGPAPSLVISLHPAHKP